MRGVIDEICEAWHINQRANQLLLDAIDDESLTATLSKRGGRSVARQFAHLHDNRVFQLEKRAPAHAEGLARFAAKGAPKTDPDRRALVRALERSSKRVEAWFRAAHAGKPRTRLQKRGLVPTLGYLIAHEAHHRGNVMLTLKECGRPVDKAVRDGIWNWNAL